jgi:hypothetical protein
VSISLAGGISIAPLAVGISTPGGISLLPGAALFGNIVTGESGALVGVRVNPAFGSTSDPNPDPPGGGTALFEIFQFSGLTWQISFSPFVVAADAWTSVTLENDIDAPIVLLSTNGAYTSTVFTTPGSSRWTFAATADLWHKLGDGAGVQAIFA